MIEIITSSGVSLDLEPDSSFDIEINQPMLSSDHIPVPYSTPISFLPSQKNCREFGYIAAMKFEPTVQKIKAYIYAGGIQLMAGILEYDSIDDDGTINYTFAGKSLFEKLENMDLGDSACLPTISQSDTQLREIRNGEHSVIKTPLLINQAAVTNVVYEPYPEGSAQQVSLEEKYHNHPSTLVTMFTPAVSVYHLLCDDFERNFINLNIDSSILEKVKLLYILGQYKPTETHYITGHPVGSVRIGDTLPKINKLDFLKNIARIFCAAYYTDGANVAMKSASSVIEASDALDWSDKVSDKAALSIERPMSYIMKFANEESDNTYDASNLKDDLNDGDLYNRDSYTALMEHLQEDEYRAIVHTPTGDVFSGKTQNVVKGSILPAYLIDIILQHLNSIDTTGEVESADSTFDNSIDFKLVRCVPDKIRMDYRDYDLNMVAPVISFPATGTERGSEVYIGVFHENQLCDKGHVIIHDPELSQYVPDAFCDYDIGLSLDPHALSGRHQAFIQWIGKRRQTVTADVNLSLFDVANFRMFKKVFFAGRQWIVRKLTITLLAKSDNIEASGEFISV